LILDAFLESRKIPIDVSSAHYGGEPTVANQRTGLPRSDRTTTRSNS
jgi:hypothetical protein